MEAWKPISGFHGKYEISSMGRVRSFANFGSIFLKDPKILKLIVPRSLPYPQVTLVDKSGKKKNYYIHKLVAHEFIGKCPEGMQVCHLNDVRLDNRVENLSYGTAKNNKDQAFKNNRCVIGSSHKNAKLNEEQVNFIRKSKLISYNELSNRFGISKAQVSRIINKTSWRHP